MLKDLYTILKREIKIKIHNLGLKIKKLFGWIMESEVRRGVAATLLYWAYKFIPKLIAKRLSTSRSSHKRRIYDPRNGWYVTLKRPLSNQEKAIIDNRRRLANESNTEILKKMGLIKGFEN